MPLSTTLATSIATCITATCLATSGPPIGTWEDLWLQKDGGWALADLTAVGPAGETYVTARPQAGGGNATGLLRYTADGALEWAIVNEYVADGSEGFSDIEITDEGVSALGIATAESGLTETLLVNYAANGTLLWETRTIGPAIPGFLQPQLAIAANGDRVIATDNGEGAGSLERYTASGKLLFDLPLSFSGFGGVSALELDGDGNIALVTLHNASTYRVTKYGVDGTELWTDTEGGTGLALSEAFVAIHPAGDIVVTGSVEQVVDGELSVVSRVWRYSPGGAVQWTTDTDIDFAVSNGMIAGPDGEVYVLRRTTLPGSELARIDSSGDEAWKRSFEGKGFTTLFTDVAIDPAGGVFVSGPDSTGFLDFHSLRVLRYDSQGDLQWTDRVMESPDHDFLTGDMQTGPDGRVSIVATRRADPIFDDALTIQLHFAPCLGDLDGTGVVGITDLLALLGQWGPQENSPADFDTDGDVDTEDLLTLLSAWGVCDS